MYTLTETKTCNQGQYIKYMWQNIIAETYKEIKCKRRNYSFTNMHSIKVNNASTKNKYVRNIFVYTYRNKHMQSKQIHNVHEKIIIAEANFHNPISILNVNVEIILVQTCKQHNKSN